MTDPIVIERMDASDAELDAAEEQEKHWMHIVKVVFIVGKIGFVAFMMAFAAKMYYSKYRKCTMIPIMLCFYIICLIILIALDMTRKYIAGFFVLIFLSNYFNFLGFYKILDSLPGAPGVALRQKTKYYFITMNVLYGLTLASAFVPRFGPFCTADKVYPACLNWTACLFIINFIFHVVIDCKKDYFLAAGPIVLEGGKDDEFAPAQAVEGEKHDSVGADTMSNVTDADGSNANLDWTDAERADNLSKKMFRGQMKMYLWFQVALVICNVAI